MVRVCVKRRRPKAGDAPHEGLLKVECVGFRVQGLGLGVQGSGFRCLRLRVQFFFFWRSVELRKEISQSRVAQKTKNQPHIAKRSAKSGEGPSVRRGRRLARPPAKQQRPWHMRRILLHRRLHPKKAERHKMRGASRARAPARLSMSSVASVLHLPSEAVAQPASKEVRTLAEQTTLRPALNSRRTLEGGVGVARCWASLPLSLSSAQSACGLCATRT